jgi:cell division initiation protein
VAITPLEIRKKAFNTQLRGYAPKEVRAFLGLVANELEEVRKERAGLAEKLDALGAKVDAYEKTEKLLKDTLLTAQKATDELRGAAERESSAIVEQAKLAARQLDEDMRSLRQQKATLLDEVRAICNTYLAMADRLERGAGRHE